MPDTTKKYNNNTVMHRLMFDQFKFFIPLALTSVLIALTHTLFNAGLARLPNQDIYIAAFFVAKGFMNLFQSAVFMIPQTAVTFVKSSKTYKKVLQFTALDALFITILLGLVVISGLARWIMTNVMGLQGQVLEQSLVILAVLSIFPAAVTLRNFFQGIAIRFRVTSIVTLSSIIRMIYVLIFIFIIKYLSFIPPGILAGIMFLGAGLIESLVLALTTRITIGDIKGKLDTSNTESSNELEKKPADLTYGMIMRFFYPLIFTSLVTTIVQPIINTGLGRTASPEMAISAFSVAWSLGYIFTNPLNMFHQLPMNFLEDDNRESEKAIKLFGGIISVFLTLLLIIISFTPVGMYILTKWIGASQQISVMSMDVLKLISFLPLLIVTREYLWGVLMRDKLTKVIGRGKIVSLSTLIVSMLACSFINFANPAIIGALGMISAELSEFIYLVIINMKHKREKSYSEIHGNQNIG
ncbi:MAG: hypothetical protein PHG58_03495 [Clostridia bacterium]|nr:hypothetical protein [Clostridia bacterium]